MWRGDRAGDLVLHGSDRLAVVGDPLDDPKYFAVFETAAKLDEQLAAAVKQTADNSMKLLEWDFAENEARCRQLASMYLDEVRQLFVGWPEKRIKSADDVLAAAYERGRRDGLEEAASTLDNKMLDSHAAAIRALMPKGTGDE